MERRKHSNGLYENLYETTQCSIFRLRGFEFTSGWCGKATMKRHPVASIVLLLATLTQAVKVFGFGGVKWAQAIAAVYLCSHLALVAIQVLAKDEQYLESPPWETNIQQQMLFQLPVIALDIASSVASFFICAWVIYKLEADNEGNFNTDDLYTSHNPLMSTLVLFSLMVAVFIQLLFGFVSFATFTGPLGWCLFRLKKVLLRYHARPGFDRVLNRIFLSLWTVVALYLYISWVDKFIGNEGVYRGVVGGAGVLGFCLICGGLAVLLVGNVFKRREKQVLYSKIVDPGSFLLLVSIMHLVVACLYFGYFFDPTGTSKPA